MEEQGHAKQKKLSVQRLNEKCIVMGIEKPERNQIKMSLESKLRSDEENCPKNYTQWGAMEVFKKESYGNIICFSKFILGAEQRTGQHRKR